MTRFRVTIERLDKYGDPVTECRKARCELCGASRRVVEVTQNVTGPGMDDFLAGMVAHEARLATLAMTRQYREENPGE